MNTGSPHLSADRIERALLKAARLVECDPVFTPIFEALERDLAEAREREAGLTSAQLRARALLRGPSPQAAREPARGTPRPHTVRGRADARARPA